jgi:hypothetical protein
VFERVRSAVDDLKATARAIDPLCVDGRDAAALFEIVSEGERVCAAMKALMGRRVEQTGAWRKDGHRSAAHWVADATGATVGAAARTLETARALDALPETDAAFRAGQLSELQAAEITSTASADPGAEAVLLETVGSTSVKGLRDRCGRCAREPRRTTVPGRAASTKRGGRTSGAIPTGHTDSRDEWRPTRAPGSTPPGKLTSTGSSGRLAALDGTSPALPTRPMRLSRSPVTVRVSRSRSSSLPTAPRSGTATRSQASVASSPASVLYPSPRRGRCSPTRG